MNSYQVLYSEADIAIQANDENKLHDIVRRIKNLSISPSCRGYAWKELLERITPSLKQIDRSKTLDGLLALRRRDADQVAIDRMVEEAQIPLCEIEELSDDFIEHWASASKSSRGGRRGG